MEPARLEGYGEPRRWILAFARNSDTWWVRLLAFGRYKHVCAFGYVGEADTWVFYDVRLFKTHVIVARGAAAKRAMAVFAEDADLIGVEARAARGVRLPLGFWCVPAIKHLIGLRSGALRPDRLYADCLRIGAEIISDESQRAPAGPGLGCPAGAGEG